MLFRRFSSLFWNVYAGTQKHKLDFGTMLPPNELLLDTLHCADYKTLVLAKLTAARFRDLINEHAEKLAHRRSFRIVVQSSRILYKDVAIDGPWATTRYGPGHQQSLADVCREVDAVIGAHAVAQLTFWDHTWNASEVGVAFETAPPLKHAECVDFLCPDGSTIRSDPDALLSNFVGLKELDLMLHYDGVRKFNWTFLREDCSRELRLITLKKWGRWCDSDMDPSVGELVRQCVALPRLQGGEPLELDLSKNLLHGGFGLRIIELLKDTGCELTVRMQAEREGELELAEGDYTVHVDGTSKRYASDGCGIVVEVNGRSVTIQSTAVVPRKKAKTSGEALPFGDQ